MNSMQIVIEIPDEVYERFGHEYREENLISKRTNDIILNAICNGTPLPSGDAISRQAVLDMMQMRMSGKELYKAVYELPPVTPMQRTGHWIETAEEYYKAVQKYGGGVNEDTPYFVDDIACSVCLAKYSVIDNETERFDCCPSCGAKMEEQA